MSGPEKKTQSDLQKSRRKAKKHPNRVRAQEELQEAAWFYWQVKDIT